MTGNCVITAGVCLVLQLITGSPARSEGFAVRDGDTVVFLGDSITATRGYGKIIENYTLLRFPDRTVRFINAGIGGDTAAGGLTRLQRDVFDHGATLLTVAFGINDIGWGLHADEEHRRRYLDSIRGIVQACRDRGVRVYVCSAAVTGGDPDKTENDYLQQMCDEGLAVARQEGGQTIDVQRGMRKILRRVLSVNESLPAAKRAALHREDTIHLTELGELAMAWTILKGLGAPSEVSSCTMDARQVRAASASGCRVIDLESSDNSLAFTRLDDGLPFNNGLFAVHDWRFVPMNQLNAYELTAQNLRPGSYTLTAGGREVGTWHSADLQRGINIASATANVWQPGGPWDAQATALKSLTDARHNLQTATQYLTGYLPDSPVIAPLKQQASVENARLEEMQRLVAKPRPYRFVLTRRKELTRITAPLDYQVFQRTTHDHGPVLVSGTTSCDADRIEFRCTGTPAESLLTGKWLPVAFDQDEGTFRQFVNLPAGGWYSMEIRLRKDGSNLEEHLVKQFGVGEVFVGAGQSNSTNSGEFRTKQLSGMVASFSGDHWQIADDPQPGVADKTQGGSYYPAFGDALFQRYGVPVGIAATGFGGTSVNHWQPGDEGLFTWMMKRISQLGPNGFRAVLWHQGESDVGMPSDEYHDKLQTVIEASRREAGWHIPWLVAQTSYLSPQQPRADTTRNAQARLWAEGIAVEGPDTDTLTGDHRDHDGQGVHFSPKGLRAHGLMWADRVQRFIDQQSAP